MNSRGKASITCLPSSQLCHGRPGAVTIHHSPFTIHSLQTCIAILVLFSLSALPCLGAKTPRLRFTTSADLKDLGLKVRLMPDARAVPMPAPSVYPYVARRKTAQGEVSERVDMYDPREVWVQEQNGGLWTDEFGNAMVIAAIVQPFPGVIPGRRHITREEYDKKSAAARKAVDAWTQPHIVQWVADFTGARKVEAEAVKRPPFNLSKLLSFKMHGLAAQKIAYAFQVKRRGMGSRQTAGQTWVFVLFNLNPMIGLDGARDAILTKFLPSVAPLTTRARRDTTPGTTTSRKDESSAGGKSTEFQASRKRVAESIRNMENWWYDETDNYIILSNLQKRHRTMVRYLKTNIEIIRGAYSQLVPAKRDISSVSVVRVFATPEEYENFVGPNYRWTGGLWAPAKKELVIRPIDWGGSRDQRARVLSVTYHEGFHQYLAYALDEALASPWFNEGHAAVFETASIRGTRIEIPENQSHTPYLEAAAKAGAIDVRPVLFMSYAEFYAGTDQDRGRNYALAWGLIYYLRKAAPIFDKKDYVAISDRYCGALVKTGSPAAATTTAFKGIDMGALARDLAEFWKSRTRRRRAERNRIIKPVAADS